MSETVHHPLFARLYTRLSRAMEERGAAEHRDRLLAGASGRVVEIGAGNGMNFAHYPTTVTEVVAVEPEPYLRRESERNARAARVPVRVVDGLASRLPLDDASVDVAVASLVLCSVGSQPAALAEIRRVLRPDGELRFFEHVRAEGGGGLAGLQRVLDATVWPLTAGGCHTGRDTVAALETCGWEIVEVERFAFPDTSLPIPTKPHVLGRARPVS